MYAHHEKAIKQLVGYFRAAPGVISIILGGSVAKGNARRNSDIDAIVVLDSKAYNRTKRKGILSECIFNVCDYPGGYFDVKYFPKDYLVKAAEKGSEPTRNSFVGAKVLSSLDSDIPKLVAKIGRYPAHEKVSRIKSFYAAYRLNAGYFWTESQRSQDPYFRMRTSADITLFGSRLLLAHTETLFPCQKWLVPTVRGIRKKPRGFTQLLERFASDPCQDNRDAFCAAVDKITDWPAIVGDYTSILSRFVADNEQWWWKKRPTLAEW